MDSSHVGLWVCGRSDEYFGYSDAVENDLGHWKGDGFEFGEGQVVNYKQVIASLRRNADRRCRDLGGWRLYEEIIVM
jgi:hypothetical protein